LWRFGEEGRTTMARLMAILQLSCQVNFLQSHPPLSDFITAGPQMRPHRFRLRLILAKYSRRTTCICASVKSLPIPIGATSSCTRMWIPRPGTSPPLLNGRRVIWKCLVFRAAFGITPVGYFEEQRRK
jgi:hypothetical protein